MNSGDSLGPYRVLEKLGEGGMGEVYRALDTTLQREVALKVLPESFAADSDRVTRFRREAQVLASLNHPHIAQIYGLEQAGTSTTLVMELVTGETLAARIGRGALPIAEAIAIASQITQALEAAHEQHIIHRDLKPANVALRGDGTVKVLDFGLAKTGATGATGAESAVDSPTITSPAALTVGGMILGTAAYMAPEQARGKTVDQRADIWAFGCVLFEMLTGRRAFEADDMSLTLAKILEREPDFGLLPRGVPPHVAHVLRLCLRKDPKTRLAHMSDVRLALDGAFHLAGRDAGASASRWWLAPAPLAVAAMVLSAAGWFAGAARTRPTSGLPDPVRLSIVLPTEREYDNGSNPTRRIALSPDGTRIVVGLREEAVAALYQRTLNAAALERIPGTDDAAQPAVSPDGSRLAFFAANALKVVGFDGAMPRTLVDDAGSSSTVVWRGDDLVYTVAARREVWRIPASGGTPQRLALPGISILALAAVPGTDDILCGLRDGSDRIDLLDVKTGALTPLLPNALLVAQTDSGHVIFVRDNVLMAAAFDAAKRSAGAPVPVVRGFAYDTGQNLPQVAMSTSGTLAYVVDVPAPQPTLEWVDRAGAMKSAGQLPARASAVDLSPTGALAVVSISSAPRRVVLWDMQRQVPTGLQVEGITPRWHPDGRRFAVGRRGQLALVDADAGTETVLVSNPDVGHRSPTFSRDGSMLAYVVTQGQTSDIYAVTPGETKPRPVVATPAFEHSPALSPDGKWLAYVDGGGVGGGEPQVYIVRFPSGTGRRRVTTNDGNQPLWRQDGRALFYREYRDAGGVGRDVDFRVVDVDAGEALTLGVPKTLFPVVTPAAPVVSTTFGNEGAAYHAAPDGNRFLMVYQTRTQPLTEIAVVQHLATELQRSAPRN